MNFRKGFKEEMGSLWQKRRETTPSPEGSMRKTRSQAWKKFINAYSGKRSDVSEH